LTDLQFVIGVIVSGKTGADAAREGWSVRENLPKLACLLAVAGAAVPLASCGAVLAAGTPSLSWAPCRTMSKDWDPADERTECTSVAVPLDSATPDGRRINLMVSRRR
jgi:hypothetical protein